MKEIKNMIFPEERALYNENDIIIDNCQFKGQIEGESALKEANNVIIRNSLFDLRYPLWHVKECKIDNSNMTINCRAPLWYSTNIEINKTDIYGVKAIRECENINITNCNIISNEFGWKNRKVIINNSEIEAEYILLDTKELFIDNINLKGKYSFQYISNSTIQNSRFDTKDMLWHAKNVIVKNCHIKGEYLGWYSENVTFINCNIIGTQPLCYAKNLKLIDCTMEDADLAFEYSDVEATIIGKVDSIKNPISGKIVVDECDKIIKENSKYQDQVEIIIKNKECA